MARQGTPAIWRVVFGHQTAQAAMAEQAIAQILLEQEIDAAAEALLNSPAFTTELAAFEAMLASAGDAGMDRLVESIVQDAGRAAEQVAVATRNGIGWVRHLTLPSCSRCVPLAGRVYRYSDGFLRHPGDDCVTTPVRAGDDRLAVDPVALAEQGHVTGLSKADMLALRDGADFNQVVNVRLKSAGMLVAGQAITRAGRPTPAGIYRLASDRAHALELLQRFGYLR